MNHQIIDARWRRPVNELLLKCKHCGREWWHASNRWRSMCPGCFSRDHLHDVREEYADEFGPLAAGGRTRTSPQPGVGVARPQAGDPDSPGGI